MCEIGVELYPSRTPEIKIKDIKNVSQLLKHSFINVITGLMTGSIGVKLVNDQENWKLSKTWEIEEKKS